MNISTKGRYATRIMVFIAMQDGDRPVCRHSIAKAEEISADYVGQILMKLKTAGLVRSHRGIHGGFSLARAASEITVSDILIATEGEIALAPCTQSDECLRSVACSAREIWREAEASLKAVFESKKLSSLAEKAIALDQSQTLTFSI